MSKRKQRATLVFEGSAQPQDIDVEVLICNRCGAQIAVGTATRFGWVAVLSDGRGGRNLDFCVPAHVVEYFGELVPSCEQLRAG